MRCVGLEFWVLWFFFFFFGDRCIKEEVNMAELGMDLILMVAALSFFVSMVELALKRKKRSSLFSSIGG